MEQPPKKVFLSGGTPTFKDIYSHENKKAVVCAHRSLQYFQLPDKKAVVCAQRSLQYFQMPDKNFHSLSGDTW
jgi:hypothetical protein